MDKLSTGQTRVIVRHNWGRGTWTETIPGDLREGKEYARFEPGVEVRIRCVGGELVAETRTPSTTYVIKTTSPPWQYRRG